LAEMYSRTNVIALSFAKEVGMVNEFVTSQQPPSPLYHYTSAGSLIEILKSRVLWASSIHCTNDSSEYVHAFRLTRELCADRNVIPADFAQAILASLDGDYRSVEMESKFVACFSKIGDLLSQWRAYGGSGSGFSIGFEPEALLRIAERNKCLLLPCLYTRTEQTSAVQQLLRSMVEAYKLQPEGKSVSNRFGNSFVHSLKDLAASFKHHSFAEEREWRLVTSTLPSAGEHVSFRPGNSLLTPYVHLSLADDGERLPISHAVVGPTPRPEYSRYTLIDAFATYCCIARPQQIEKSASPFRGWW
jgi:Protein of unknown function (DUF2971)